MLQKVGIILTIVSICIVGIFVYMNKNISTRSIEPVVEMKSISGTTYVASGTVQDPNEWNPSVMRVGQPVQTQTGVTVTVSTNGPAVRSMSPEEIKEFQKKMQGK